MSYLIGVDVGGTTTTLAVGNDRRQVVYVADQFPTRSEKGPHEVVRAIVERHGGTISVASESNISTVFTVLLPTSA